MIKRNPSAFLVVVFALVPQALIKAGRILAQRSVVIIDFDKTSTELHFKLQLFLHAAFHGIIFGIQESSDSFIPWVEIWQLTGEFCVLLRLSC